MNMGTLAPLTPQKNTANLLLSLGLSPTFSGWVVNPGTAADITNEITNALTTPGQVDYINDAYITYDLGSSQRVSVYAALFSPDYGHIPMQIEVSDDNATWDSMTFTEDQVNVLNGTTKAQYIRLHLPAFNALMITKLSMRVYLI